MNLLKDILSNLRPNPGLLGMDSNIYHALWNPHTYTHTHRESEDIINLMNKAGLLLRSKPGVPTFISNHARQGETTVNLQWMSLECYDWATVFRTDTSFECAHFSDHLALTIKLDLPASPLTSLQERAQPNWSKTNWEVYRATLSTHLLPMLTTLANTSTSEVGDLATGLTNAVTRAIEASTPTLTVSQRSRRWWCANTLNPLKGHANNLRRRAQRTRAPADRVLYRAAQNRYQQACKDAKISHWRTYLASLSASDLSTAARYTNGPTQSRALPPLRKPDGQLTSNPEEQAHLLFQATGVPTIPCDLSDVTEPPPAEPFNKPFTTTDIQSTISKLKFGKAPGTDGITNQVIKESPEALATILATLLNSCVESGSWPKSWKRPKYHHSQERGQA